MMNAEEIMEYSDARFIAWLMEYRTFLADNLRTLTTLIDNYKSLISMPDNNVEPAGYIPAPNLVTLIIEAKKAIEGVQFGLLQHNRKELTRSSLYKLWYKLRKRRDWVPNDEFITQVNEAKQYLQLITDELLLHQKQVITGMAMADSYQVLRQKQKEHDPSTQ